MSPLDDDQKAWFEFLRANVELNLGHIQRLMDIVESLRERVRILEGRVGGQVSDT